MSINACATTVNCSGGKLVGGHCWYLGDYEQSCTQVCAALGKTVDLAGIKNFAGSAGTDANCKAVASSFGINVGSTYQREPVYFWQGDCAYYWSIRTGIGCALELVGGCNEMGDCGEEYWLIRCTNPETTADAYEPDYSDWEAWGGTQRFCACQ